MADAGHRQTRRLSLPSGDAGGGSVEISGQLLGRDHAKFIELGVPRPAQDSADFRAVVKLDGGTLVLAALDSIVGRDDYCHVIVRTGSVARAFAIETAGIGARTARAPL